MAEVISILLFIMGTLCVLKIGQNLMFDITFC